MIKKRTNKHINKIPGSFNLYEMQKSALTIPLEESYDVTENFLFKEAAKNTNT